MRLIASTLLLIWSIVVAAAQTGNLFSGAAIPTPPSPQITCNLNTGVATGASGPCASPTAVCDGATNDAAAFNSFKTWALANQGSNQVVLTIAGNCAASFASNALFPFEGINDFILSGYGATVTNLGSVQPILFGGQGQFHDNLHSVRTATVSAGSSCVTLLGATPTATISAIVNSTSTPAAFTGSITGATLTVTAVASGALEVGQFVSGVTTPLNTSTTQITALGTGTGGTGTYTVGTPQTSPSQSMTSTGQPRLTVNSTSGISSGDTIFIAGVTGSGQLLNLVNGLQWIKVVDGTHLDLFQKSFSGTYTSGGSVNGDRSSLFTVGQYALMTGFVLQAYWAVPYGFPSNHHYFEWVKVASINAGTQQICFDAPLVNTYKSTWPQFNVGNAFEVDAAGPATLYALRPSWNTTQEYRGVTLDPGTFQMTTNGRSITWRDATFLGVNCAVPSQNLIWRTINVTGTNCAIEFDKLITEMSLDTTTMNRVTTQSSSTDVFRAANSTFTNGIYGFPKKFIGTNVVAGTFQVGTQAYGRSDEFTCTGCAFTTISPHPLSQTADNSAHSLWSMSGGVITIANTLNRDSTNETQTRGFVPGTNFFWAGSQDGELVSQVIDVTQDLTNTYVTTNLAGGFPNIPYTSGGALSISPHPAPKITCMGCSGSPIALDWNSAPAASPYASFAQRTYTPNDMSGGVGPNANLSAFGTFVQRGNLTALTFNVSTPFTGTGGSLSFALSRFSNWPLLTTAGTFTNYGPTVNTSVGGSRVVTLSGVTGTQSGDTGLGIPDAITSYFSGPSFSGPIFSRDVRAQGLGPSVTVTIQTDQGVVIPRRAANDNRSVTRKRRRRERRT